MCLDPVNLPFTRRQSPHTETRQRGLFGVLRDACADGFGLDRLQASAGRELDDPLELLELGAADAVGAVEVCEDISRKIGWRPMSAQRLIQVVQAHSCTRSAMGDLALVIPELQTSLGGERPKLTFEHEGQLWIAKLSVPADAPYSVVREFAAMHAAHAAGIDVAETQFVQAGHRQMLLVCRFDRQIDAQGAVRRRLFASAHTVLGLDRMATGEDPRRSYVALAAQLGRWNRSEQAIEQQRQLYLRMVFNAVCANGDDHPRNHGVMLHDGAWQLTPAFDIAPPATFSGTLSMAVNRAGRTLARASELLADCDRFGLERAEAYACIEQCVEALHETWPKAAQEAGLTAAEVPVRAPSWLALEDAR